MSALLIICILTMPVVPPSESDPALAMTRVTGMATWYRAPLGHAAAGRELRNALGRGWRGMVVKVCRRGTDRCTRVTLTDWCGCPGARIIDLPAANFQRLAPLWRGVISVRVTR